MITFASHFLYFNSFGLYEDDYSVVGTQINTDFKGVLTRFQAAFKTWPWGRPLAFSLPALLTYIGVKLGGLKTIYIIGFIIIWINASLTYKLVNIRFPDFVSLICAIFYIVYPADTAKILLTHSLILHVSFTFLLISSILYLQDKKVASYVCIIGTLITYETPILPFFAIPLLKEKWDKKLLKNISKHIFIIVIILFIYFIFRLNLGEEKLVGLTEGNKLRLIGKFVVGFFIGPLASGYSILLRPFTSLLHNTFAGYIIIIIFNIILGGVLYYFFHNKLLQKNSIIQMKKILQLFGVGIVMVIISYGLTFVHYPPIAIRGRLTSVHIASTLGWGLILSAVSWLLFQIATFYKKGLLISFLISSYLSLLIGFHVIVQKDFVKSWNIQRTFWRDVISLCPDMTEKTVIFLDYNNLPETTYIKSFSWALQTTLEQIFHFPEKWKIPPRLYKFPINIQFEIKDGIIKWYRSTITWWGHYLTWETLDRSNVILLEYKNNILQRKQDSIIINNTKYLLTKRIDTKNNYNEGQLYNYIYSAK
jgi:hypothetical protein